MPVVLLETLRPSTDESGTIWIENPEKVLQTNQISQVSSTIREVQNAVHAGYFAAGFVSYEAGRAFLPHLPSSWDSSFPLVWFALTRMPERFPDCELPLHFSKDQNIQVSDLELDTSFDEYAAKVESIKRSIELGQTYQVNFTMRYRGNVSGSPRSLYKQLRSSQRVAYAAYIETDPWAVISLSPELFFRKRGRKVFMRPMKGTSPRGRTLEEDIVLAQNLTSSEKERAENLMIVDLLRNDLGKICVPGTVNVTRPLQIEKYETLLQMTSSIEGTLPEHINTQEVLEATFPSGSVTGAPKLRTMQIIQDLEKSPRRVYTGAIGFISKEESVFNVAIRTAIVEGNRVEMGIGSGILYEADAWREYRECELKARFLTEPARSFQLIETILWSGGDYQLLDLHLRRLLKSAEYFLIPLKREKILGALQQHRPDSGQTARVRLLADSNGNLELSTMLLEPLPADRVCWATQDVNSRDVFLYHKTTLRHLYERELQKAREQGCVETFFRNERGEVTEGAFSNIWILRDGVYHTPPVSCGLLAGTYREFMLESESYRTQESVLLKQDLEKAEAVFISNAIRGLVRVTF